MFLINVLLSWMFVTPLHIDKLVSDSEQCDILCMEKYKIDTMLMAPFV